MKGYRSEQKGTTMILFLEKEVDHHLAGEIRKEIDDKIDCGSIHNIIFDFKGVGFMDSSGIGMIMGRYRKVRFFGGKVAVSCIERRIDRIFSMSGVYQLIPKYPTLESALESLK